MTDLPDAVSVDVDSAVELDVDAQHVDEPQSPPEPPRPLQVASHIAGSQSVRDRITAYVKMRRWQDPDADLRAPIPLDDLAAAVSSDQQVADWICQWQTSAAAEISTQVERACTALPDAHITRVVDAALERLAAADRPTDGAA